MLEIKSWLKIHTPKQVSNDFYISLTQDVIADAIDLTNVLISNAFEELASNGLITHKKKF